MINRFFSPTNLVIFHMFDVHQMGGHLPKMEHDVPKSRDETRFPLDKATNLEGVQWKNTCLVSGFNHLEKYEFVNGKDEIPYMKWKIIHSCLKPPTRCLFPFQAIVSHALPQCLGQNEQIRTPVAPSSLYFHHFLVVFLLYTYPLVI